MDAAASMDATLKAKTDPALIRPFLKWAGNKYRILDKVKMLLPEGKRLIEPFVGSAALFLNSNYPTYLLCDTNADLINLYKILKQEGTKFIRYGKRYFNGEYNNAESYYTLRDRFNTTNHIRQKAALFIYLNRHGYNGLCRYNKKGGYNVPFGRYIQPYFPEKEMLAFHHRAQSASFRVCSFEESFKLVRKGDVIYCDPPYAPLTETAKFTSYSAGGFELEKQIELAELAEHHSRNQVPVLISNHDTPFTCKIYSNADTLKHFKVQRSISCKGQERKHAGEVLALFTDSETSHT